MSRSVFVIVLIVLIVSGCSTNRTAVRTSEALRTTEECRTERRDSLVVEQRDTFREVTTVTVDRKENGDTVRVCIVTERDRVRDRDNRAAVWMKTEVKTDTVVVERRDSVNIRSPATGGESGRTALHFILKWCFAIVIGLIALTVVLKIRR